jgi:hypothetical protein
MRYASSRTLREHLDICYSKQGSACDAKDALSTTAGGGVRAHRAVPNVVSLGRLTPSSWLYPSRRPHHRYDQHTHLHSTEITRLNILFTQCILGAD